MNRGDRGTTVFKPSVLTVMTESRSNGLKVGNNIVLGKRPWVGFEMTDTLWVNLQKIRLHVISMGA